MVRNVLRLGSLTAKTRMRDWTLEWEAKGKFSTRIACLHVPISDARIFAAQGLEEEDFGDPRPWETVLVGLSQDSPLK